VIKGFGDTLDDDIVDELDGYVGRDLGTVNAENPALYDSATADFGPSVEDVINATEAADATAADAATTEEVIDVFLLGLEEP